MRLRDLTYPIAVLRPDLLAGGKNGGFGSPRRWAYNIADYYLKGGFDDAVFYDAPNVGYFAQTKGKGRVKTVGPLYEGQQYGLALVEGSEWLDDVNEALASMKEDGTYDEIYKKWFGSLPEDND